MRLDKHLFFCVNARKSGDQCCANFDAEHLRKYAKEKVKKTACLKKLNIRVNKSGCLNRCQDGPVMVIYPEGVWYTFLDEEDIDEIIDCHLVQGTVVDRLLVEN
jgi:(2Fe-2S) ferredoxin